MVTRPKVSRTQLGGSLLLAWLPVSVGFLVFLRLAYVEADVLVTARAFFLATVASFAAAILALALLTDAMGLHKGVGAIIGLLYGGVLYALSRSPELVRTTARAEFAAVAPGYPVLSWGTVVVVPLVVVPLGYLVLRSSDASFRSLGDGHVGLGFSGYTIALVAVLYLPLQVFLFGFIQDVGWYCLTDYCSAGPGLYGVAFFTAVGHGVALLLCLPGIVGGLRALFGSSETAAETATATTGTDADRDTRSRGDDPGRAIQRVILGSIAVLGSGGVALGSLYAFGGTFASLLAQPVVLAFVVGLFVASFAVQFSVYRLYTNGSSRSETNDDITDRGGPDDWPQPGHDAAKTAAVPDEPGPASNPGTVWQTLPDEGRVATAPAVAHGMVLAVTDDADLVGVDAASGEVAWTATLDGEDPTPPAVTSRVAYVGTDAGIHAHRVSDGDQRWSEDVGPVETLTAGDVVYVGTDDAVVALRPTTGSEKWTAAFDAPVRDIAVHDATAVGPLDDTVYATTDDGVVALSPATGDEQWRATSPGRRPRLAIGQSLVVSSRSGLRALDAATGDELWRDGTGGDPSAVAVAHGRVYQTTDTTVRAVDDGTGAESWRTTIDAATPPVVVGDTVYVVTPGEVVGLDAAESDAYAFTHDIDGAQSTLAVAGNAIFLSTADGALTTVTGELADDPTLAGTTATASERVTDAAGSSDDGKRAAMGGDAGTETGSDATDRDSVAARFARDCQAVTAATVVDDTGPVHVYDGRVVDSVGKVDARVYALAPDHRDDDRACEAFLDAARSWQSVGKNTHVATVFETGTDPGPWVAFDPGTERLDGALPDLDREQRLAVVGDLAEATRTAGMYNLVHGSVAPEVVFLADDDLEGETATLADWGLHRAVADAIGEPAVTPYTAPEQLDGESAGTGTDIYRLGALAAFVLTGEPPFPDAADLPAAIRAADRTVIDDHEETLAPTVATAIHEATAVDPDERAASAYDFKQRLLATRD